MQLQLIAFAAAMCALCVPADAAERLIKFKPAKGVTIGVPKGWKACDEASDKRLGSTPDPMNLKSAVCESTGDYAEFRLGVFLPDPERPLGVYMGHSTTSPIDQKTLKSIDPAVIRQLSDASCAEIKTGLEAKGIPVDVCNLRLDKMDGKTALVTRTSKRTASNDSAETEIWEVPYKHGSFQISFIWSKAQEATLLPMIKRMKASIDID